MADTPNTTWVDGSGGGTPITATRLNNMEQAIPYELAYTEFTAPVSVTATTEATANTVVTAGAVTFDGATAVWIEFFAPYAQPQATAGAGLHFLLYDGAASIGFLISVGTPATGLLLVPVSPRRRLTPSAAAHTYSVRAYTTSGTGTVGAGAGGIGAIMPGFVRIVRA